MYASASTPKYVHAGYAYMHTHSCIYAAYAYRGVQIKIRTSDNADRTMIQSRTIWEQPVEVQAEIWQRVDTLLIMKLRFDGK